MRDGQEERLQTAQEIYEDLQTYMSVGFTREEAMKIMCRPWVTFQPAQYPPEMFEFWERQNAFATKALKEMDSD